MQSKITKLAAVAAVIVVVGVMGIRRQQTTPNKTISSVEFLAKAQAAEETLFEKDQIVHIVSEITVFGSSYNEKAMEQLEKLLFGALQRNPDDRYPTALAFYEALEAYLNQLGERVTPASLGNTMRAMFRDRIEDSQKTLRNMLGEQSRRAPRGGSADAPPAANLTANLTASLRAGLTASNRINRPGWASSVMGLLLVLVLLTPGFLLGAVALAPNARPGGQPAPGDFAGMAPPSGHHQGDEPGPASPGEHRPGAKVPPARGDDDRPASPADLPRHSAPPNAERPPWADPPPNAPPPAAKRPRWADPPHAPRPAAKRPRWADPPPNAPPPAAKRPPG